MSNFTPSTLIIEALAASDKTAAASILALSTMDDINSFKNDINGPTFIINNSNNKVSMYSVNAIPDNWQSNTPLTGLNIGGLVTSIGNYAFQFCDALVGDLTIPNSVTSIGDYAFQNCSGLTGALTIGNSVTSIGSYAFYNCLFTGALTIPNSVTSIGSSAFYGCSGFTGSLAIPNSVTSIGNYAFSNCSGFTSISSLATTAPTLGTDVFNGVTPTDIHVPVGATGYGATWGGLTVIYDL